jgi:ribose transport system substrate-binding protein
MKRKILLQLVVPLLSLCVLFLLLAFDPGQAHADEAPLEVSILHRESDSTLWSAARQGMEQAAADMGVELRFLAPSVSNQAEEQENLLSREVAGGTDAIVLVPSDQSLLAESVAAASTQTVVITMETEMADSGAAAFVGVDNAALGEALGQAVLNGVYVDGTVLLLNSVPGSNGISARLEAAAQVLEGAGRTVRIGSPSKALGLSEALPSILAADPPDAIIAFEADALELAAAAIQGMNPRPLLYGMGATDTIAAHLEQGIITAIAAQNEFAAGYLAVDAAVRAVRREAGQDTAPLAYTLVRKETMYHPDHQKLLFPVTR